MTLTAQPREKSRVTSRSFRTSRNAKRSKPSLRSRNSGFRELYDEAPFGYHEIDTAGRIVTINRTECRILGYDRAEIIGQPIFHFIAEEFREVAKVAVREKMAGLRDLVSTERPYVTKDGRQIIVAIEEGYRLDNEGRIIGLRSTMQDVSHRAQTERSLVASERRARALFEGIEDVVVVHDYAGQILDVNPAALKRFGYSREELLQLHTSDVDDPSFAAGFKDRLNVQVEQGYARFEGRHRTRDGRVIPVEMTTSKIRLEETDAILALSRDITERKALEATRRQLAEAELENARALAAKNEDLSRSEARYRMLTEGSHDAVVVADQDGRITLFNPAAERIFGYSIAEVIGEPIHQLMPDALRDAHSTGLERYVATRVSHVVGRTVETDRTTQDRRDLSARTLVERGGIRGRTSVHRVDPRSDRASENAGDAGPVGKASLDRSAQRGGSSRDQQPVGLCGEQPGRPGA